MSYELKISPKKRAASRFIGKVRKALVSAAIDTKKDSGLTQQQLALALGVNRSAITRMLKGEGNLTLRSVGELAWAMGWEPDFTMNRRVDQPHANRVTEQAPTMVVSSGTTRRNVVVFPNTVSTQVQSKSYVEAAE
jgi:plasmid maintenance system antidote protein VapI